MLSEQLINALSIIVLDDDDLILDVTQAILENMGVNNSMTHTSASKALATMDFTNPYEVLLV